MGKNENERDILLNQIERLNKENKVLRIMNTELISLLKEEKKSQIQIRYEKIEYAKQTMDALEREHKLIKEHRSLIKKYHSLSKSKLGKLTIKYWSLRKKLGGKKIGQGDA